MERSLTIGRGAENARPLIATKTSSIVDIDRRPCTGCSWENWENTCEVEPLVAEQKSTVEINGRTLRWYWVRSSGCAQ